MDGRGHQTTVGPSLGVRTFLFTDIEGSTRRWESDPEAMRAALKDHDAALSEAIAAHEGWLFKHTGDGVCAAFRSPRDAVEAAIAAQWTLELPVRMAITTGEAERRGSDYFGAVLNRAARVLAAGHGGQILLDGLTAGLLNDVDLVDLGPRRLRDLTRPVGLFQVRAPGLGGEFPPLRTLDPAPGNLRRQTTTFIGRDAELADVQAELDAHRLVTLTGVGGVGKTRLALEAAARAEHRFPDGVWVIELAPVGDPDGGARGGRRGIGDQSTAGTQPGRKRGYHVGVPVTSTDLRQLRTRPRCCRRPGRGDPCALGDGENLATSREALRVADEKLWRVPSLDVDSAAGALFVERASGVAPATSLSDGDEAGAIHEICRRLDGIPLAIELAASRMVSMTAVEVRDRLDDRFRLLVGPGERWSDTKPCTTPSNGRTTSSTMPRSIF